jgi:hypothetical protein
MMAYLSLLVESREFDEIYMNYLIVGHTHSLIDQFFSVLSKAIKSVDFIGSPLALEELFLQKAGDRIAVIRPITVFYDFPSAISPFLNSSIKVSRKKVCICSVLNSSFVHFAPHSIFKFPIVSSLPRF